MKAAVLLIGHGSRFAGANKTLRVIAELIRQQGACEIVEVAFLERHETNIQQGIDTCIVQGAECIVLYPYFLFAGAHVVEDLPAEIKTATARYPGLKMVLSEPLGAHPKVVEIVQEQVAETLQRAG